MSRRRNLSFFLEEKGYINQPGRKLVDGTYILSNHVSAARLALDKDRDSLYRNALIAYSSTYKMILSKNYSWAFVHSYYSLMYFYQVILAFNDVSLCYDNGSPFYVKLTLGSQFHKTDGNTHRAVIGLFKNEFASDTEINSEIDGKNVCDWFEEKRNSVNYKTVPQIDPNIDYGLFNYDVKDELRKQASVYLNDLNLFAYTPEHSYVAYPLLLINRIKNLYDNKGQSNGYLKTDKDFVRFLGDNIRDKTGKISSVIDMIIKDK